jgi:hypothetical protein
MSDTELLPKPKPEPVRRLEVFTGTGRRTAEQKAQILTETCAPGRRYTEAPRFVLARLAQHITAPPHRLVLGT